MADVNCLYSQEEEKPEAWFMLEAFCVFASLFTPLDAGLKNLHMTCALTQHPTPEKGPA